MLDLSIIILSYKSKDHLAVLLPSVFGSKGVAFALHPPSGHLLPPGEKEYFAEVIIVDNGSGDGTVEWVQGQINKSVNQQISLIKNSNTGFSAGNNVGIRQSSGRYVLLLNPDTKLEPDTLEIMLDFMESRPDVGISGCKLIKADGTLDLACRRRFPNPWNSFQRLFLKNNISYNYSDIPDTQEMEVDSVVGAFLLIRRPVMELIGLLDEDYFMYGEDLDWCWRCKEEGFKVWYYPKAICHHYKGESSKKAPFRSLLVFHQAMWIFYKKHYAKQYPFFFGWLVWLGIHSRLLFLSVKNLFKAEPFVSK